MKHHSETAGFVYFVAPKHGGPIKIGFSAVPTTRLVSLQAWSPFELEILAQAPAMVRDEYQTQNVFIASHIRGEWFKPTAELYALIEEVKNTGKLPPRCLSDENTKVLVRTGDRATPRKNYNTSRDTDWWEVRRCQTLMAKLRGAAPRMTVAELAMATGCPDLVEIFESRAPLIARNTKAKILRFIRKITRLQSVAA